mmetsp:Transcript_34940/g.75418  ORF Transcript_34940/g.75418 Transcript_34940/m.75418 type:complete len:93 (-) Transcript_34940:338-616(-)
MPRKYATRTTNPGRGKRESKQVWVGENWKRGPEQMKSQKQQKTIAANGGQRRAGKGVFGWKWSLRAAQQSPVSSLDATSFHAARQVAERAGG